MIKAILTILFLFLPLQTMAATRLQNIIETGTKNYNAKPNSAFINALYLEFHNRKATPNEVKRFENNTIQDSSNIIAGKVIIKKPKIQPKTTPKSVPIGYTGKRYQNKINIKGKATQEEIDYINDYGSRVKLKEPIDINIDYKIPDEMISRVDKGKQEWIKNSGQQTAALYDWPTNQMFINNIFNDGVKNTFTHEFGHSIDDQYGLQKQFPTHFGETIQADNTNPLDPNFSLENVANHIKNFLQNNQEYKIKYPNNFKYLNEILMNFYKNNQ